jgi:hypothetical protein
MHSQIIDHRDRPYPLETLNNFLIKNIVKNIVKYKENVFFPFVLFNVFKMFLQCFCS